MTFVGTDGHRLATSTSKTNKFNNEVPGVIIPKKTINELSKLLSEYNDEIEIDISTNKIIFYIENLVLISKLIDGNFPDYTRVIPNNNNNELSVKAVMATSPNNLFKSKTNHNISKLRIVGDACFR